MVQTAQRRPFITAREIAGQHAAATHQVISTSTVKKRLVAAGLHSRTPKKAPVLTRRHVRARREYVNTYGAWNIQRWRRVMFSDESRFALRKCDGRVKVWRRRGTRHQHFQGKMAFGGGTLMFWGGIMFGRKTALVEIPPPGGLTQRRYIDEVLVPHVLPVKEAFGPGFILQQDNATAHVGRMSRAFLEENNVNLLVHPAMSPDLNPIEHLWDNVDRKVRAMVPLPDNMQELRAAVLRAWDEVTPEEINTLIRSMPKRCQAVQRNRGGNTLY